jgi:hypothetical protein
MEEVEAGEEEKEQREHATLYMPIVLRYPSVFYLPLPLQRSHGKGKRS